MPRGGHSWSVGFRSVAIAGIVLAMAALVVWLASDRFDDGVSRMIVFMLMFAGVAIAMFGLIELTTRHRRS